MKVKFQVCRSMLSMNMAWDKGTKFYMDRSIDERKNDRKNDSQTLPFQLSFRLQSSSGAEDQWADSQFRYTFLDGSQMTTKPIGQWTIEGNEASQELDGESTEVADPTDGHPESWCSYSETFSKIQVDEQLALKINDDSMLLFFLERPGQEEIGEAVDQKYVAFFEIDVSLFLNGQTREVVQVWHHDDGGTPVGIERMEIHVSLTDPNLPFLTPDLHQKLNPMMITISNASNVPGISISSPSLQGYVRPTPYVQQHERCEPVFVTYRFFQHLLLPHRVFRTSGLKQVRETL